MGREWDDTSPDDRAACGAIGEAGTGIEAGVAEMETEAGKVAGGEEVTGRGDSSDGRGLTLGPGKSEATGSQRQEEGVERGQWPCQSLG